MNVIGDVAGRFDELQLLLAKMPKADKTIYVGDLNDRGPKSKEVIDFVMNDSKSICLQSNHGDMMVDFHDGVKRYHPQDFLSNGGTSTCASYDVGLYGGDIRAIVKDFRAKVPPKHIEWLRNLDYYHNDDKAFISHAARNPNYDLVAICTNSNESIYYNLLWNRGEPSEIKDKLQIMGHNSHWGVKRFGNHDKPWAMCIDGSRSNVLTGLHVPTMTIYQQEYLD